ncbi:ubiquinol-cytochrome C reductase [Pelagibacteraceae bacterium GOM-A3]|nr:ubiquinol-cytochrome C reductase [Pelagibacteraceae bacterium GOM-A3]
MNNNFLNIYNNLIKLTRNKNLYLNLKNKDTFSDRLIIFLFHFAFFLKFYKNEISKNDAQNLFDFIIRQIELSIREIGYGDVSVNKKMKDYVNLFYSVLENIEKWEILKKINKNQLISDLMNIKEDNDLLTDYFDKYTEFLRNNSLKNFTKDILEIKF